MNVGSVSCWCLVAWLVIGTGVGVDRAAAQPARPDVQEGAQVLTRGPVHEAFAATVSFDPEPGILVARAPPEAIEEVPPLQRPEGANVAWIPGYWAWDDERGDFLWVSGIWRALPPGRQWVPGYWGRAGPRFQWMSGYWADARASEVNYLPEPPQSIEAGPNVAATSADHHWLSGCWVWQQSRYAWRPGFWAAVQPDWVWVPAYYVWSPRGYVFVDGYWDYAVGRRGVLFAPVYFNAGVYTQRGFYYSPTTVIDLAVFVDHLFLRPNYCHYYFGDYYAASYQQGGFYASHSIRSSHRGCDPIYDHQRWQHRHDRTWEHRKAAEFQHRRDHENDRPPRTLAAQKLLSTNPATSKAKSHAVAMSLDQLAKKDSSVRFQPLGKEERLQHGQRGREVHNLGVERQKLEAKAAGAPSEKGAKGLEPAQVKLPKSPILGKSAHELGKGQGPPTIHAVPKPDFKIEAKPKKAAGQPESPKANKDNKDKPPKEPAKEKPKDKRKDRDGAQPGSSV